MTSIYRCITLSLLISVFSTITHAQTFQLWYRQPAQSWTQALPIGNGRLGAMIYGDAGTEHLQFNEETLWSGRPREHAHPGAANYLQPIRQLLADGKQKEAEELAEKHFMGLKDPADSLYPVLRDKWLKQVRLQTAPAATTFNDTKWKEMSLPTPDGYERTGLTGLDGAVWFRTYFDMPAAWAGKNLVLDLGRIRDMDFTYVNGKQVGTDEGTSKKRRYTIPANVLKTGRNSIAIQVINFFDKGGLIGVKGSDKTLIVYPEGEQNNAIELPKTWKYFIQNDTPPLMPRYEADYQPFGDVYLKFANQQHVNNYRRELDITNAVSSVTYTANGVNYTREYFASAPQQCVVMHVKADKAGAIDVQALLNAPHRGYTVRTIDDRTLALNIKVYNGVLKGQAWLYVTTSGGTVKTNDSAIVVQKANEATFYLVAATSFKNYKEVSADPAALCKQALQKIKGQSYVQVKEAHIKDYQKLFNTFAIHIPEGKNASLPTNERIRQFNMQDDPSLTSLYLQYGRYLMIASSRPGTQPANLQGIWNDLLTPPWGSKYTTNINLEMNYWPAEVLNLSDCAQPLFKMIEELAVAGKATARAHYNAPGWVLHHNTDLWRGTAPINASNHGIWVTGGAWLCLHVWEHFLFTQDTAFLRQYYPVMKEAANFFVNFLVKDPQTGYLISTPSNSPEQGGLVAGPTMDHQIIRELFTNTAAASAILKTDQAFAKTLQEKIPQIAPNKIGKHGQLQEWMQDVDDPNNKHRHISHLWGVYPGTDITWKDSAMMKAARQSLIYRGDGGTGWSIAWKVNCWARFKDGDHSLLMLKTLLHPAVREGGGEQGGVYDNLFDAHPPFQIDGNFGGASGMAEMLVQSHEGMIELLPALPTELPNGEVKGLCARGGFVVDLEWKEGRLEKVKVESRVGAPCRLQYGGKEVKMDTKKGGVYTFDRSNFK
jgi:Glycosyl hydrolases family 2, sugar binding domain.